MNNYLIFCVRSAALVSALLYSGLACAIDQITISLGDLQGDGWQAQDVQLNIDLPLAADLQGDLSIASVQLPVPLERIDKLQLRCRKLSYDAAGLRCDGNIKIAQLLGEALSAQAQFEHVADTGAIRLKLHDVALAGGRWQFDIQQQADAWTLQLKAQQIDTVKALALLQKFVAVIDYSLTGKLSIDATLRGAAAVVNEVQFKLTTEQLEFANASGTQAAEKLNAQISAQARNRGSAWQGDAQLAIVDGNIFIDPLYLEITPASTLRLASKLHWSEATQRLQLSAMQLEHAQVAQAQADMQLQLGAVTTLESLDFQLAQAQLPAAYLSYIQPWLHGHIGDALETAGQFSGRYQYQASGDTALQLRLQDLAIADTGKRFSFEQLKGVIDWGSDALPRTTSLQWDSGSVYKLALGAAKLAVQSHGTQFELQEATRIPVLDGVLELKELALSDPGGEQMRFRFDGALTPVSMEAVCEALDWPKFGGQLAGRIPAAQYADGVLEVGAELQVQAFDGTLAVRNLRLEQPFGRVPRLYADLLIENLDLDALTNTFEFGKIEGRLSGHVNQLRLESWQPVAFDARFATPADDNSRHRISQKAVDNLSNIGGGGVGGALSRSFMGVFEEFPYAKLGLSCVLRNGICLMGGVEATENGYYIVKSRFIPPRIDVVGYADRVDWNTLIERLQSVTLEQAPVVR